MNGIFAYLVLNCVTLLDYTLPFGIEVSSCQSMLNVNDGLITQAKVRCQRHFWSFVGFCSGYSFAVYLHRNQLRILIKRKMFFLKLMELTNSSPRQQWLIRQTSRANSTEQQPWETATISDTIVREMQVQFLQSM